MTRRLPRSIDELRGLRAARWIRESTRGQIDNFGPDAQREQQTRAIERYELVDVGVEWAVAHSGRTIDRTPAWAEMLAAAGDRYDVLVVGYVSRFSRSAETHYAVRRAMHERGAVVLFADERILTSDEDTWEAFHREIGEAESYSRRLAKRISEGYAAKFRRLADQAGNPPLGFRRAATPPHALEPDPSSIGQAVRTFELYAAGSMSMRELAAATDLGYEQVVKMLKNPLYNGWVRRHRGRDEERMPAPWRANPPVDDELWRRVADLRGDRLRGGGPSERKHEDLLRGLLHCAACGRRLRANGTSGNAGSRRRQRIHPEPCPAWTASKSLPAETWEPAIAAQFASIDLDTDAIARVRDVLATPATQPIDPTRARLERQMRELGAEHVANRISDSTYLTTLARLREEAAAAAAPRPGVDVDAALTRIADMAELWSKATAEERAELAHVVYARIDVIGGTFRSATLTPAAYAIGLDQVMAEIVRVKERPRQETGTQERPRTVRIPINGRRERLIAARRKSA